MKRIKIKRRQPSPRFAEENQVLEILKRALSLSVSSLPVSLDGESLLVEAKHTVKFEPKALTDSERRALCRYFFHQLHIPED